MTVYIESEGLLFRGPSATEPEEIWHYPGQRWVPYPSYESPVAQDWGCEIDAQRAEILKTNNGDAEHFRYYDFPPWSI